MGTNLVGRAERRSATNGSRVALLPYVADFGSADWSDVFFFSPVHGVKKLLSVQIQYRA